MSFMRLIRIALNAIGRNRLRTFLTMLGIIIGVASVIAMLAIGQGAKQNIQQEIAKMGTNVIFIQAGSDSHRGASMGASSRQNLSLEDAEAVRNNCPHITAVSPQVSGSGQVIYGPRNWSTAIQGVNTEFFDIRKLSVSAGDKFTAKDIAAAAKVCLIGQTIVENLFDGEEPLDKIIRFNKIPFRIIGVLEKKGEDARGHDQDDIIIAPYTTVQKRVLAITHITAILSSAESEEVAPLAQDEVIQAMRASHKLLNDEEDDFRVRSQQELISTFSSTSQLLTVLLASIAGISLVVGGIGIMNIMYVSVTERTREIGLRMAVGARSVDIMYQFLIESVIISITGGIFGLGVGLAATSVITLMLKWPSAVTPFSIILSFAVCVFTGIFFGWYPASKASRLDPIEALRYE